MMGMVHIYTGDGKGKTTAAVGLCTRAAGHGKKAAFYEFLKGAKTGEAKSLAALGVEFTARLEREKFTWTMTEEEKAECRARQADTLARAAAHMAEYDLVVLDEVAVRGERRDAVSRRMCCAQCGRKRRTRSWCSPGAVRRRS